MRTAQPATKAAERRAALLAKLARSAIDLAREHDDDLNYAEVEQLLAATRRPLILRELPLPARSPRPLRDGRRRAWPALRG